jgi:hypothetical protein
MLNYKLIHKLSKITISLKSVKLHILHVRRYQYLQVIKFKNLTVFMELEHLDSLKCRKLCSWFVTTLL